MGQSPSFVRHFTGNSCALPCGVLDLPVLECRESSYLAPGIQKRTNNFRGSAVGLQFEIPATLCRSSPHPSEDAADARARKRICCASRRRTDPAHAGKASNSSDHHESQVSSDLWVLSQLRLSTCRSDQGRDSTNSG